jgi:hypothetical protein
VISSLTFLFMPIPLLSPNELIFCPVLSTKNQNRVAICQIVALLCAVTQ